MQIIEIETLALIPNDRLRVRVLKAKSKLATMGFKRPIPLLLAHTKGRYSEEEVRMYFNLRACSDAFTADFERMVEKMQEE